MSQTFFGVAVIYGAKGSFTIDGTATGTLNSSIDVSRPMDHIVKLTDSEGKRKGYVIPEDRKRISVTFTPSASSLSALGDNAAVPVALAKLVIASADVDDVAGTYIIDENCSSKFSNTGAQETQLSGTRYVDDSNTAALATVVT